ncbi:hypothetical protein FZ983_27800 [Azospirillum sp. B21]|uniref:hypothetical protein n=1 Tax=Azospirillum sp. B21 TaxID=2607496 RepID=UPI0011ED1068|nr:hypothetical protein [Azospirillum sp. B21]KAA0574350.1 hypothetical protein FZ983_27800 [Azospirillum sp. B21]
MSGKEKLSVKRRAHEFMLRTIGGCIANEWRKHGDLDPDHIRLNVCIFFQIIMPIPTAILAAVLCILKFVDDGEVMIFGIGFLGVVYTTTLAIFKASIGSELEFLRCGSIEPDNSNYHIEIVNDNLRAICATFAASYFLIIIVLFLFGEFLGLILNLFTGHLIPIFSIVIVAVVLQHATMALVYFTNNQFGWRAFGLDRIFRKITVWEIAFLYRLAFYGLRLVNIWPTIRHPTAPNSFGNPFRHDDHAPRQCSACKQALVSNWPNPDRPWIERCAACGTLHPTWIRLDENRTGSHHPQLPVHLVVPQSILFLVPNANAGAVLRRQLFGNGAERNGRQNTFMLLADGGSPRGAAVQIHAADEGLIWSGQFDLIIVVPPKPRPGNPLARPEDDLTALLSCIMFPAAPWSKRRPNASRHVPATSPPGWLRALSRRITQPPAQYKPHELDWLYASVPILAVWGDAPDQETVASQFGRIERVSSPADIAALLSEGRRNAQATVVETESVQEPEAVS